MIQDQLFRGISYVEQEDINDKSNRDKALLMEKLGAIKSADEFGTAAVLRNKFSHHYPEEIGSRIERLNLVIEEAGFVIATFDEINNYIRRKGFSHLATLNDSNLWNVFLEQIKMIKVLEARYLGDHRVKLIFSDGKEGVFDGTALLARTGSLVEALREESYFKRLYIDAGALCWPNSLELAPSRLYENCIATALA